MSAVRNIFIVAILVIVFAVPVFAGAGHAVTVEHSAHADHAYFQVGQAYSVTSEAGIWVYQREYDRNIGDHVQMAFLPTDEVFLVTANFDPTNAYAVATYRGETVYVLESDFANVGETTIPSPKINWVSRVISQVSLSS